MGFYTRILKLRNILLAATSLSIAQAAPIDEPLPIGHNEAPNVRAIFSGSLDAGVPNLGKYITKISKDKLQADEKILYVPIDSAGNSLTMENDVQEPFTYEPVNGELGLILRGFFNPNESDPSKINSKNNIFIKTSSDLGLSWEAPVLVYNNADNGNLGGRYPSLNSVNNNGETVYGFTASLVDEEAGVWFGFVTGVYGKQTGNGYTSSPEFQFENKTYNWGGRGFDSEKGKMMIASTESKIIADIVGTDGKFALAVGGVTPVGAGVDTLDNNNIAFRSSVDLENPKAYIPPQMTNSKFEATNTQDTRTSTIVALRKGPENKYYLGVFGNFAAEPTKDRAEPGFSVSTDMGATWSEFNIMPGSLLKDFSEQNGMVRDSSYIDYRRKDMAVLNDGTVVFALVVNEVNATKSNADLHHIIAAVSCSPSGVWSIEKIANQSGWTMSLIDDKNNDVGKPSATELQLSKTIDDNYLVAKWVDLSGIEWTSETSIQYNNAEVYFSTKKLSNGSNKWSDTVNATKSVLLDRDVWIPYLLPTDLRAVPAVQLITKAQGETLTNTEQRQYLNKQYVVFSQFDALGQIGVNDPVIYPEFKATLTPNPATNRAELSFTAPGAGMASVKIYNSFGELVMNAFDGPTNDAYNAIELKLGSLPSGSYFVRVQAGEATTTEKLNIIR